jgi:hypothetical protein
LPVTELCVSYGGLITGTAPGLVTRSLLEGAVKVKTDQLWISFWTAPGHRMIKIDPRSLKSHNFAAITNLRKEKIL